MPFFQTQFGFFVEWHVSPRLGDTPKSLRPSNTVHPGRLRWNLRMDPWKRKIFQTIIFRFYVNLQGSIHPWFANPPCLFHSDPTLPPLLRVLSLPPPNSIHQRNFSKTLTVPSLQKKKNKGRPPTISKQNQDLQHKVLHLQSLLDSTHLAPLLPTSKIAPLKYHAPPDLLWVSWHSRMVTYFVAFVVEGLEVKSLSTTLGDDWTPPSWHSRNWHRLRLGEVFREKKKSHDLWKRCFLFFCWGGKVGGWSFFIKNMSVLKGHTWKPKQPCINGCFSWMIPNHYIKNGGKPPFPSIKTWLFMVFQAQAWCFWWVFVPLSDISTSPTRTGSLQGGM